MIDQNTFKSTNPKIYLVGTPIGNLEDFSFRAIKILNDVDFIFCEDTRTSKVLLNKYQIKTKVYSLHKFNETKRLEMISEIIKNQQSIAIISDAGVPVISDPGAKVIHFLRQKFPHQVDISAVNVGPAYIHGLIVSGFLQENHYFYGFLKNKAQESKKQEILETLNFHSKSIIIFYESVYRLASTINLLFELLPFDQKILIARELTKLNEEILIGTIQEVKMLIENNQVLLKGEFVIIIDVGQQINAKITENQIVELVDQHLKEGMKLKQAAHLVAMVSDFNPNEVYQIYLKKQKNS